MYAINVTLHVSVWVEIISVPVIAAVYRSRSTWACELKYLRRGTKNPIRSHAPRERVSWNFATTRHPWTYGWSRSTWACELKCDIGYIATDIGGHAPRERVSWNTLSNDILKTRTGHAPRERVSWNALEFPPLTAHLCHAPRERVSWNFRLDTLLLFPLPSRSTWACELKSALPNHIPMNQCHAPRERVSWNNTNISTKHNVNVTLHVSVWVEILSVSYAAKFMKSRSTWACELKYCYTTDRTKFSGHAPRERVSWNAQHTKIAPANVVTLHVSVWVEIALSACPVSASMVTLHVSVWVEIIKTTEAAEFHTSRSTWACELK